MLYLVKIGPNLFFLALTPVTPGVIKVPLEVSVGCFVENKRAAGDGAGEPRPICIGGGERGWKFQGIRGGNRCSWGKFTFGGGNASGYGTFGHAFMGVRSEEHTSELQSP